MSEVIFTNIQTLILIGDFKIALQKLQEFESDRSISKADNAKINLFKAIIMNKLSRYDIALKLIETALSKFKAKTDTKLHLELLIQKADILKNIGSYDETLSIIDEVSKQLELQTDSLSSLDRLFLLAWLKNVQGIVFLFKNQIDNAIKLFNQSLDIYRDELKYETGIADSLNRLGKAYVNRGDLDKGLEYLKESLFLREKLGNKNDLANTLCGLGIVYQNKKELGEALAYFHLSLDLYKQIDATNHQAFLINNIAEIYINLGDLNQALEKHYECLDIFKELKNKHNIGTSLINIGTIYLIKGDLKTAEEIFQESIEIFLEIGIKLNIAENLSRLAEISYKKEDYNQAMNNLLQALELTKDLKNYLQSTEILLHLVLTSTLLGKRKQAKEYLIQLEEVNKNSNNLQINQRYLLANAFYLKSSSRIKDKMIAMDIFETIENSDIIEYKITVDAMLNLCELLLEELKISEDKEVFSEINSIIDRLLEIAKEQNSPYLFSESYKLKAKAHLLDFNIREALKLLTNAQQYAEINGVEVLAKRISQEFDILLEQLDKWDELENKKASLLERMELSDISDNVQEMIIGKISEPNISNEEPVLLLILKHSCELLFSKDLTCENEQSSEILTSGFILTINDFLKKNPIKSDIYERIKHNEFTILLQSMDSILFCYIFKGNSYFAIQKFNNLIGQLQEQNQAVWKELLALITSSRKIKENIEMQLDSIVQQSFATV